MTGPEDRTPEGNVTLTDEEGLVYELGPVALTGSALSGATAGLQGTAWTVSPIFKAGENGIDKFNEIAAKCFAGDPTCPALQQGGNGQLGIVLDGVVLSAPSINVGSFERDQISISGSFDRESAESLAISLRFGSLPVELRPQQAETVSATLGQGALEAGIIAGLVGLLLALVYLSLYYRFLALVAAGGLVLAGAALWTIMSWVGATVTLAGLVGIVVSIGVTVDSAVVYFETIKESVRAGATVRGAAGRAFDDAWSTIVKANVSSLIGAVILYWLAVGPVRGFAFYLGAMTVLDLIAMYVFVFPATLVVSRSKLGERLSWLGIPTPAPDPSPTAPAASAASTGASS